MSEALAADYLIVGAGAMGMAFTDTLLSETDANVVIVDRYHAPGGHWTRAYPFVRLHQPSAFYGVNSKPLGSDSIDAQGWNEGLYELASGQEVCAYFDQVMQQTFLPSGRVRYLPYAELGEDGVVRSLVSDATWSVSSKRRVDATYMQVSVPSMREPPFEVAAGVCCVPPNELPRRAPDHPHFTVVGAGKTGMDACLFLLWHGVAPERIRWIMPRDSWMLNRAYIQPGKLFAESLGGAFVAQVEACIQATGIEDLFERLHASGNLLRYDPDVFPTMYRCATVTEAELAQLQRLRDVIRLGHVQRITPDKIQLDQGDVGFSSESLVVDCTADGLARRPPATVFDGDRITLQALRTCQQVFSAAFIAHVEACGGSEEEKNELCQPVPHPDDHLDYLRTTIANDRNALRWRQDPGLVDWLVNARLDGFSQPGFEPPPEAYARQAEALQASIANLEGLLARSGALSSG